MIYMKQLIVTCLLLLTPVAQAATWFVATNGSDAAAGTSWATAKLTIQAAIDASAASDTVLVSNGVYQTGGRVAPGFALTNRVFIHKPVTVRSVNGPAVTAIRGAKDPLTTNGNAAVRCVWMTNGATLVGFTLTNGATRNVGNFDAELSGGGVYAQFASAVAVSNCTLIGNSAFGFGGGALYCPLNNCVLTGNSAESGGGAFSSTLNNCTLTGNSAKFEGGGVIFSTLNNCTLTGNLAGDQGGGAMLSTLNNCIVYFNTASTGPNYSGGTINYSCTTPIPAGTGNITNDPLFVSLATTNLQLAANSPCINLGNNAVVPGTNDLAGNSRIRNTVVDMGAFEFQGAANPDYDGDGSGNADEFIAATDPTNSASFFPSATVTNALAGQMSLVIKPTSTGRVYGVYANTNLLQTLQAWTLVPPEQTGTATALTLTITNTLPAANYRTGVRLP
jgi:hypothetical protein